MGDQRLVRSAWHSLGRQLAAARKSAGLNQEALGVSMKYSRSSVANIEIGRQHVDRAFWEKADEQVGAGGELVRGYEAAEALHRAHQRRRTQPRSAQVERQSRDTVALPEGESAPRPVEISSLGLDHAPIDDGHLADTLNLGESPEELVVIFGSLTEVADSRGWKAIQPLIARSLSGFERAHRGGRKSHGRLAFAESRWFEFMS